MELRAERLRLREVTMDDMLVVHDLHSMAETDKFNTLGIPENIETTKKIVQDWILAQQVSPQIKYVLIIEDIENNFVGLMGINIGKPKFLNAEFWYKLHPAEWNKGYATEAVKCCLDHCFGEFKLHRITAGCAIENTASRKVLEKCGFTKEGHFRKVLPIRGEWVDGYEFALLEEDYFKMRS